MNLFQRVNVTATFAVVSASATGLVHGIAGSEAQPDATAYEFALAHREVIGITIFSILLRFKTCFDDHYIFGDRHSGPRNYWTLLGFLLGLLSWATWIISGSLSYNARYAALWLFLTLGISTIWIVLHFIEVVIYGESQVSPNQPSMWLRAFWLVWNPLYMLFLGLFGFSWSVGPLIGSAGMAFSGLFVLLVIDFVVSHERIASAGHES